MASALSVHFASTAGSDALFAATPAAALNAGPAAAFWLTSSSTVLPVAPKAAVGSRVEKQPAYTLGVGVARLRALARGSEEMSITAARFYGHSFVEPYSTHCIPLVIHALVVALMSPGQEVRQLGSGACCNR